jgi:hypothetical protein
MLTKISAIESLSQFYTIKSNKLLRVNNIETIPNRIMSGQVKDKNMKPFHTHVQTPKLLEI